jgi:hypothetical protein
MYNVAYRSLPWLTRSADFEQYTMFSTLPDKSVDIKSKGKRVIFIGDVHGSFDPLR